jgi:hypothetical protein
MTNRLWTYVQQMLHQFAESGGSPPHPGAQSLVGPNGALIWTLAVPVSRPEPIPDRESPVAQPAHESRVPAATRPKSSVRGLDVLSENPAQGTD